MLLYKPKKKINGILDFISNYDKTKYFYDCNQIAKNELSFCGPVILKPKWYKFWKKYFNKQYEIGIQNEQFRRSVETEVLRNCSELLISNYCHNKKGIKVIDVGCGSGGIINNLKHCEEKVALDYSLVNLHSISNDITKIRANAENIPIESNYFDIVICIDVFEHVINEDVLSKELYRILKPGGMLLFATPWEQDISIYDSKEYKDNFILYECRHRRSVNDSTIKKNFLGFDKISKTLIEAHMPFMKLKPYSLIFIEFRKKL